MKVDWFCALPWKSNVTDLLPVRCVQRLVQEEPQRGLQVRPCWRLFRRGVAVEGKDEHSDQVDDESKQGDEIRRQPHRVNRDDLVPEPKYFTERLIESWTDSLLHAKLIEPRDVDGRVLVVAETCDLCRLQDAVAFQVRFPCVVRRFPQVACYFLKHT